MVSTKVLVKCVLSEGIKNEFRKLNMFVFSQGFVAMSYLDPRHHRNEVSSRQSEFPVSYFKCSVDFKLIALHSSIFLSENIVHLRYERCW